LVSAGAIATVLLVLAAGSLFMVNRKFDLIPRLSGDTSLDEAADDEAKNYLVVGSDSRDDIDDDDPNAAIYIGGGEAPEGKRADVIMVVRVDPNGEQLDILSLQRDLWLPISGTDGSQRINTAYEAGPQQLIDTIRDNFAIEINHYVEIDFRGFQGIVDTIDGVPLYFERAMRDRNSGLYIESPGCVTLNGQQALAFARARYLEYMRNGVWQTDPTGDLGRISRQQIFMRRMFDRTASKVSFTDIRSMNDLADVAIEHMTLDADLEITKAINVAKQFGTFEGESIKSYSLPVESYTTNGGAAVLRIVPEGSEEILNIFRDTPGAPIQIDPADVTLAVRNGSGIRGQAGEARDALELVDFTVTGTGDAEAPYDNTTVLFAPGSEATARAVARWIDGGAVLTEDAALDPGEVQLVTGADFDGLASSPLAVDDPSLVVVAAVTTGSTSSAGSSTGGTTPAAPAPTTTTTVGVTPGEPPPGTVCE